MKKTIGIYLAATMALTVAGCGQLEHGGKRQRSQSVTLAGSMEAIDKDCNGGYFQISLLRDYIARRGKPILVAKGFAVDPKAVNDKTPALPNGVSALMVMGQTPTTGGRHPKKFPKLETLKDFGEVVRLYLNSETFAEPTMVTDEQALLKGMTKVIRNSTAANSAPVSIDLDRSKKGAGYFKVVEVSEDLIQPDTSENGKASTNGIGRIQSAAISISPKASFTANFPPDIIGSEKDLDTWKLEVAPGTPITIPYQPSSVATGKTFFTVELRQPADDNPNLKAIFRLPDEGKGVLSIPTVDSQNRPLPVSKDGMAITVTRSHIEPLTYDKEKGLKLCVETDVGVMTTGAIKKP